MLRKNLDIRSHGLRFRSATATKYHANGYKLQHDRKCSQNRDIITAHNRKKHRKYLGELILSPPTRIKDRFSYYKTVHARIIASGFGSNVFLNNVLIPAYSKWGGLRLALNLFDKMPKRSLISWSSVISALNIGGQYEEALRLFLILRSSGGENPNEYVLDGAIHSCTHLLDVEKGLFLHACVTKWGYEKNSHVGSSLVDFYSKTGDMKSAELVYDQLREKNVVTRTSIIAGYASVGEIDTSLSLFREMLENGVVPDLYTLSTVLVACSIPEFLDGGKQVHAYVLRSLGDSDVSANNLLIDFYFKCREPEISCRIFESMGVMNQSSWTIMICGCRKLDFYREAVEFFTEMNRFGYKADEFSCSSVFVSCGSLEALQLGTQIHAYAVKMSLISDKFVANALVDMYCRCNSLVDARKTLILSPEKRTTACCNAVIEGYSRLEKPREGFDFFREMRLNSVPPNEITFVALLGLLSSSKTSIEATRQLHSLMIKYGFHLCSSVGSSLVDSYSKLSLLEDARLAFEEIPERDIVTWNTMLFGYSLRSENYEEALSLFIDLLRSIERPNSSTFVSVLMASRGLAVSLHVSQLHSRAVKIGLESSIFVANALIDAYAKCGDAKSANLVFDNAVDRDLACWNTLISMHGKQGDARKALETFGEMSNKGIKPNRVTFVALLSSCAHAGLVEEGVECFGLMLGLGIEPGDEHYACMVSLLSRAGNLHEAKSFIERMRIPPGVSVWKSFLGACRDGGGDVELVRFATDMVASSGATDSGSFVLVSNVLAGENIWTGVEEVRERMRKRDVAKEIGTSWIETDC